MLRDDMELYGKITGNDPNLKSISIGYLGAFLDGYEYGKRYSSKTCMPQTLYGYNLDQLDLIARVLQKEELPPERVSEALNDIARIVSVVMDEFEEELRKAVNHD